MKGKILATLFTGALVIGAGFGLTKGATRTSAAGDYSNIPTIGEVDPASYMTQVWSDQCGARRISERGVIVNDLSNWGYRAQVPGRKFDITSFHISLNLEHLGNEHGMMLIFGSGVGSYDGEQNKQVVFDIVKGRTDNTLFVVTCSAGNLPHNTSIPSFTDGQMWADNSNYTGVQTRAEDYNLDISVTKNNDTLTTITVNNDAYQVNNEELYTNFVDDTKGYFSIGLYNGNNAEYAYIVNEIGDASDDVYFSADGTYGKTKAGIASIKALDLTGATVDDILAAKEQYDAIPYGDLYSYDKNYLAADWNEITDKINAAVEAAGVEMAIALLDKDVQALETAATKLTSISDVDAAIAAFNTFKADVENLGTMELTGEQEATVNALITRGNAVEESISNAARKLFEDGVTDYEDLYEAGIESGEDVLALNALKARIPTKYASYFTEEEYNALVARISTVDAAINADTKVEHNNWDQGSQSSVVKKADGSIDFVTYGNCMGKTNEESSGIYCKEEIAANDFEAVINFERIPESAGGWVTFGIMEKPEMWINAEDDSVQNNKGIFFLVTRVDSKTLGVQAFLCSLTSNRFYDSPLVQTIKIPSQTDLHISFKEVSKTIAGVSDTYFNMSFGDVTFDQENITARKLKTVLMSKTGYFIMASSGYSANNPAIVSIKSINGFAPLSESIKKEVTTDITPVSTSSEATFVHGSANGKPSFNLDTKDQTITSVKVDGNAIDANNYTYSNSKFTLTNAYANSLSIGDHTIVVTTKGGSVSWTLHVVGDGTSEGDNGNEQEEPAKKGCKGSVLAASGIVALISLVGASLAIAKKKED